MDPMGNVNSYFPSVPMLLFLGKKRKKHRHRRPRRTCRRQRSIEVETPEALAGKMVTSPTSPTKI